MSFSVLHVVQPMDEGVPAVVAALARDQVERGWKVDVACPDGNVLWEWLKEDPVTIHRWKATRGPGPGLAHETFRLARLIRSTAPNVVHLHSSKAGLVGRLSIRGRLPTIFQPHAWSFYALEGPLRRAATWWERAAARRTDAVICVSRSERGSGVAAGVEAPLEVIENGVDLAVWTAPGQRDRHEARVRLGLPSAAPIVVCVGRLFHQKGQDVLVRAWPQVSKHVRDGHLYLVGDGPSRPELEPHASGRVHLVGYASSTRDWFLAADVVTVPSRWDGLSLVLLEAMASARSVVATDVAGVREALGEGAGGVVPVGDVEALAAAILERLQRREMASDEGRKGREIVERRFDLRLTTQRVADLYAEVLQRRENSYR